MSEEKQTQERKNAASDVYDTLIERMPEMEEAMKIALGSVSVVYKGSGQIICIYGEVRPATGSELSFSVELHAVLYDRSGRIIGKSKRVLWKDYFFGLDIMELCFADITPKKMNEIGKIKLFPTKY